jgi:glyoxylase-like metal-dependent hydrolase (beta-lactamase superfamily II)
LARTPGATSVATAPDMALDISTWYHERSGTFTYLIDDGQGHCAVIDPVLDFDPASGRTSVEPMGALMEALRSSASRLVWLLETHVHADHLSGAQVLKAEFGGETAAGEGVRDVVRNFAPTFGWQASGVPTFDRYFTDGECFTIGAITVQVLHVPGHTPADVAYLMAPPGGGPSALFVGDTLFAPDLGTARCDFPGGDAWRLYDSVQRLLALPGETGVYLCHDYPPATRAPRHFCTVAEQRAHNIHVRAGIPAEEFVQRRSQRDATLSLPQLMLPAVQFNALAGRTAETTAHGIAYLRVPLNVF